MAQPVELMEEEPEALAPALLGLAEAEAQRLLLLLPVPVAARRREGERVVEGEVLAEPLAEECRLALGSAVSVAVLLGERLALVQAVGEMEPVLLMLPVRQVVAEAEGQRDCVGVRHCVELTEPVRDAEGQA